MKLKFSVSGRIARPVHEVFEAVADPAILSRYFTTGGAKGRLEAGATVEWDFADFPGAFPVEVVELVQDERIVVRWQGKEGGGPGGDPYFTEPSFTFAALDDDTRTLVTIAESGWGKTKAGRDAAFGNCMGWSQMLSAMKAWVEHGINLREGMYK